MGPQTVSLVERSIIYCPYLGGSTIRGFTVFSVLQVHSVAWSSDGSRLASGSFDKTVTVWNLESDRLVSSDTNMWCSAHTGRE